MLVESLQTKAIKQPGYRIPTTGGKEFFLRKRQPCLPAKSFGKRDGSLICNSRYEDPTMDPGCPDRQPIPKPPYPQCVIESSIDGFWQRKSHGMNDCPGSQSPLQANWMDFITPLRKLWIFPLRKITFHKLVWTKNRWVPSGKWSPSLFKIRPGSKLDFGMPSFVSAFIPVRTQQFANLHTIPGGFDGKAWENIDSSLFTGLANQRLNFEQKQSLFPTLWKGGGTMGSWWPFLELNNKLHLLHFTFNRTSNSW